MKFLIVFAFFAVAFSATPKPLPYKFYTPSKPQYVAESGKYVSDYSGDDGQYHPDNSGAYNPDDSGAYKHSDNPYLHQDTSGGAYINTISSPVRPAAVVPKPSNLGQGNAAGLYDNRNYAILRQVQDADEDGYHYVYETENGILGEEEGHLQNKGQTNEYMGAKGFYTYTGPDSITYRVDYTVGEEGFVAAGEHLPVAPPVPEEIQRSLALQN